MSKWEFSFSPMALPRPLKDWEIIYMLVQYFQCFQLYFSPCINFSVPLCLFHHYFLVILVVSIQFGAFALVVLLLLVSVAALRRFVFANMNEPVATQPENCLTSYEPHGYCVIYSSADRDSFVLAERILQTLWTSENIAQRAVILVGNKADLARSRTVTSEGKWNSRHIHSTLHFFGTISREKEEK